MPQFPRSAKLPRDSYKLAVGTETADPKKRCSQPWMCVASRDNITQLGNKVTIRSRWRNIFHSLDRVTGPWQADNMLEERICLFMHPLSRQSNTGKSGHFSDLKPKDSDVVRTLTTRIRIQSPIVRQMGVLQSCKVQEGHMRNQWGEEEGAGEKSIA